MKTNRAARRLLGMQYKISNSRPHVKISLVPTADITANIPDNLKSHTVIAVQQNKIKNSEKYHSSESFYPRYIKA